QLEAIDELLAKAGNDEAAQREIIDRIRQIMRSAITDSAGAPLNEDNIDDFLRKTAGELLDKLGSPPPMTVPRPTGTGGAADVARSDGSSTSGSDSGAPAAISFSGAWDAIKNALNYATYYEMKNRAG